MVTDTERREVARRLRERAGRRVLNLGELLWCIGCDDGDDAAAWNRLADLIEPSCDRDALLALADVMERKASNWDVTQGDVPLVHAGHLLGYADRIREVLGDCQLGVSGAGDRGTPRGLSGQVGGRAQGSTRADRDEKE